MFKGLSTTIFDLTDVSSDLIREGCWGFLAHVVDSHAIEPWLEDIPVACEFLEAFLKDLPSDSTHGSLALKAYQQNLYLEYYY